MSSLHRATRVGVLCVEKASSERLDRQALVSYHLCRAAAGCRWIAPLLFLHLSHPRLKVIFKEAPQPCLPIIMKGGGHGDI
jgi:hypothetical protein